MSLGTDFEGLTSRFIVGVLLDNDADTNIISASGSTPLEDASLKGFDSIVDLLLDHGAPVNGSQERL